MKKLLFISFFLLSLILNIRAQEKTVDEGFETWPPGGWSIYALGKANSSWIQDWQGIAHSGKHSAYSNISNDHCDSWLVTPQVSISRNDYLLKFWDISKKLKYFVKTSVLISTGSGDPSSGDFKEVMIPDTSTQWKLHSLDLSAYQGKNIYVAFRYEGTWETWFVDDVKIEPKSTYVDGALTQITQPQGVSPFKGVKNVIVRLKNKGTSTIQYFTINWQVNGVEQTPYFTTTQNITPGASVDVLLGLYAFNVYGWYNISAQLVLNNDIDTSNNRIHSSYAITTEKDADLVGINPESITPYKGLRDVSIVIKNMGSKVIDSTRVTWTVNGVEQPMYSGFSLGLQPGDTAKVIIGSYNFSKGVYQIAARLDALGDINSSNNTYLSYAAIDTLWESFEGRVVPPDGWSFDFGVIDNSGFGPAVQGDHYYTSMPDSNMFGKVYDTLYTPLLDISTGNRFKFYIKFSSFYMTQTSLVWKDGVTGEVHLIKKITATADFWQPVNIDISAASGTNYIGIVNTITGFPGMTKIDLITSDAKIHLFDHDLAITNGDIYFLAKQNTSEHYTCVIQNKGKNSVSGTGYRLKLMENSGNEIGSVNGVDIKPGQKVRLTIDYKFMAIGSRRLYYVIDYSSDENQKNNSSYRTEVNVVPKTAILNKIGRPDIPTLNMPFNAIGNTSTLGEDDLSQTIYLKSEFAHSGSIYGIIYEYNNNLENNTVKKLPLKVI